MSKQQRKKPFNKLKLRVLITAASAMLGFGLKDIQIAYIGPGYEKYEGKTVHEIARENGKSDLDMYLQLCEESDFKGRVNMGPYSTPEIIREFEHNPNCLYMTDAWVEDSAFRIRRSMTASRSFCAIRSSARATPCRIRSAE